MQFKHPELLYALFLLIIPIIVHLFQLRKFQKEAFTNVCIAGKLRNNPSNTKFLFTKFQTISNDYLILRGETLIYHCSLMLIKIMERARIQ